jgi:hypothetical protein
VPTNGDSTISNKHMTIYYHHVHDEFDGDCDGDNHVVAYDDCLIIF